MREREGERERRRGIERRRDRSLLPGGRFSLPFLLICSSTPPPHREAAPGDVSWQRERDRERERKRERERVSLQIACLLDSNRRARVDQNRPVPPPAFFLSPSHVVAPPPSLPFALSLPPPHLSFPCPQRRARRFGRQPRGFRRKVRRPPLYLDGLSRSPPPL